MSLPSSAQRGVIVTGAAMGIGRGVAEAFAALGDRVAVLDMDAVTGRATVAHLCQSAGAEQGQSSPPADSAAPRAVFIHVDVRDPAALEAAIDQAAAELGRIDVLVNNAGIEHECPIPQATLADWTRLENTNLRAPLLGTIRAYPHLRRTRGCVIHMSSIQADMTQPGYAMYAATKAGLLGLTRGMALDFAPDGVRVNAICPGAIMHGPLERLRRERPAEQVQALFRQMEHYIPAGRLGLPADVAALAVFLASPQASYITGAEFVIDGALSRRVWA